VIDQFLETPFDLGGKKASQLLSKKARRRRRRRSPSPASDDEIVFDNEAPKGKKKEKKKKEKEQYKSAQFIEDSDEEYGDIEAFLEKEKAMREKAARVAAEAGDGRIGTMKPTGTKKRRRKVGDDKAGKKKRKGNSPSMPIDEISSQSDNSDSVIVVSREQYPSAPRPRPRPRPIARHVTPNRSGSASPLRSPSLHLDIDRAADIAPLAPEVEGVEAVVVTSRRRNRLVISDEEDD
jgi:replication fork protection complex subunit Tof1/Swi1